jgi:double-stranded uracil-DNA glycosylase
MQHCFAPVVDADTRLLILGSLPGVQSLAEQRYYAHRRNQFWKLIGTVIEQDLAQLDYGKRLDALVKARVGLWDTVASATRRGSLDSDIRLHEASDIAGLVTQLPALHAIGFNGGTAARIGRRQIPSEPDFALIDLPSSSPALTIPFETKLETWLRLRAFL